MSNILQSIRLVQRKKRFFPFLTIGGRGASNKGDYITRIDMYLFDEATFHNEYAGGTLPVKYHHFFVVPCISTDRPKVYSPVGKRFIVSIFQTGDSRGSACHVPSNRISHTHNRKIDFGLG